MDIRKVFSKAVCGSDLVITVKSRSGFLLPPDLSSGPDTMGCRHLVIEGCHPESARGSEMCCVYFTKSKRLSVISCAIVRT